jgi:hypothetical protein
MMTHMKWEENIHPEFGKSLYADNGVVQLIIPLEYGIRIRHFSFIGEENVFYVQPEDMKNVLLTKAETLRSSKATPVTAVTQQPNISTMPADLFKHHVTIIRASLFTPISTSTKITAFITKITTLYTQLPVLPLARTEFTKYTFAVAAV